jgi:hypothetical protein
MNIEELEQFRGMKAECDMIKAEIEALYNPVASPNGKTEPGHSSTPGNPTEQAAFRIMERKRVLEQKQTEMLHRLAEVERWLDTVPDAQMSALLRCYYILGNTWKQTSVRIYGYPCPQRAHQRVHRFFGSDEEI